MSIATALVSDLEEEAKHTRKMLALVPEAKLAWKPHEKSMSLGQLASHLAEAPSWTAGFLEPEMDFAALEGYQPFAARTRAECLAEFEKNHRACVEALRTRDDRFMSETWTSRARTSPPTCACWRVSSRASATAAARRRPGPSSACDDLPYAPRLPEALGEVASRPAATSTSWWSSTRWRTCSRGPSTS